MPDVSRQANRVDADAILVDDWNKEPSAEGWSALHELEQRGLAAFSSINNDSEISNLMFKSASDFGSRLDIGAMSMSAHDNLKSGTEVVRWKSLDDLLDTNPRASELKQLVRDLSRDVSDHMPVVMRFYFTPQRGGAAQLPRVVSAPLAGMRSADRRQSDGDDLGSRE